MTEIFYKLDIFEGPLELLSNLLSKNKLSIYDIPIASLLEQYLAQIDTMKLMDLEISSEFLVMASRLIYLKTLSLLPKHEEEQSLKDELAGELLEYEICREMAGKLSEMVVERFVKKQDNIEFDNTYAFISLPDVLYDAYLSAEIRGQRKLPPSTKVFTEIVAKKVVSVKLKITSILRKIQGRGKVKLSELYGESNSRSEIIAIFLAVLELCKTNQVQLGGKANDIDIIVKD